MRLRLGLAGLAIGQVIAAFLLQLVVIRTVHDPMLTDAWVAAQTLPLIINSVFSLAFQGAWQTPLAVAGNNKEKHFRLQRYSQGQLLVTLLPLIVIGIIAAPWYVPIMFSKFTSVQLDITSYATCILLMGALFNVQTTLFLTALRGQDRFLVGETTVLAGALLGLLVTALVLPYYGIVGAAWVNSGRLALTVLALFLMSGCPLPAVVSAIRKKRQWEQIRILLGGNSLHKLTPLVDRYLSSKSSPGGLTMFNLSQNAFQALSLVFDRAIVTPSTPSLARAIKSRDWQAALDSYDQALKRAFFPFLAALVALLLIRPYWIPLVQFALNVKLETNETWLITLVMLGFLYPATAGGVVLAAFYAFDEARKVTWISIIGLILSIPVKFIMFSEFGLVGLASAVSIHYAGNFIFMNYVIRGRIKRLVDRPAEVL